MRVFMIHCKMCRSARTDCPPPSFSIEVAALQPRRQSFSACRIARNRNQITALQAFTIATKPNSGSLAVRLRRQALVACTVQSPTSKPCPALPRNSIPSLRPWFLQPFPPNCIQIHHHLRASPPPCTPPKTVALSPLSLIFPVFGASCTPQVRSPTVAIQFACEHASRPRVKTCNHADCSASVARRALEQHASPQLAIDHM